MPHFDELVSRLYRETLNVEGKRFRSWALNLLREFIEFDAALWIRGHDQAALPHSVTTSNLPNAFSSNFNRRRRSNPVYLATLKHPGRLFDLTNFEPEKPDKPRKTYDALYAPFELEHHIAAASTHKAIGSYSYFELYRKAPSIPFESQARKLFGAVVFHLNAAASHAAFIHALAPSAPQWETCAAIVDPSGQIYEAQPGFIRLIEHHYPSWSSGPLPFDLPENFSDTSLQFGPLAASLQVHGTRLLLRVWEMNPLDALSKREREVVFGVSRGLPFKSIGQELGLSSSTVSNYMYRANRKLGVHGRAELSELLLRHADNLNSSS